MHTNTKARTLFTMPLIAIAASCAGADGNAENVSDIKHATVKPGGAFEFSYEISRRAGVDETGTVSLTITETYDEGTLLLEASAQGGLEIFPASSTAQFPMNGADAHVWDIFYTPQQEGVFYIDVMARGESASNLLGARTYAIRIDVGNQAAAQKPDDGRTVEMSEDGKPLIIMEAEETIED